MNVVRLPIACCLLVALGCSEREHSAHPEDAAPTDPGIYVMAGAEGGIGSESRPYGSLEQAEEHSTVGDTIALAERICLKYTRANITPFGHLTASHVARECVLAASALPSGTA